jgi:hypothetical protein
MPFPSVQLAKMDEFDDMAGAIDRLDERLLGGKANRAPGEGELGWTHDGLLLQWALMHRVDAS